MHRGLSGIHLHRYQCLLLFALAVRQPCHPILRIYPIHYHSCVLIYLVQSDQLYHSNLGVSMMMFAQLLDQFRCGLSGVPEGTFHFN